MQPRAADSPRIEAYLERLDDDRHNVTGDVQAVFEVGDERVVLELDELAARVHDLTTLLAQAHSPARPVSIWSAS